MKSLIFSLVLPLLLGVAASWCFHKYVEPDHVFFMRLADVSDTWAEKLRETSGPCYVFAGGSDTRTGIDPALMLEEYELRVINAALGAGYSVSCNVANAQTYVRSGDTLVVGMTYYNDSAILPTTSGIKMAFERAGFQPFKDGMIPLTRENLFLLLLGRSSPVCTYMMKSLFFDGPLYKYEANTVIHPSGWMDVRYREMEKFPLFGHKVSPLDCEGELFRFMSLLQQWCNERQVRLVVYATPHYEDEDKRITNAIHYLALTRMGVQVLRDERLGVLLDKSAYSDSPGHLGGDAVAENTRIVARALKDNSYWTEEALVAYLREHGWNDDGTPIRKEEDGSITDKER